MILNVYLNAGIAAVEGGFIEQILDGIKHLFQHSWRSETGFKHVSLCVLAQLLQITKKIIKFLVISCIYWIILFTVPKCTQQNGEYTMIFDLNILKIDRVTESTLDCFTFDTKMTNALFWREPLWCTTNEPLKRNCRSSIAVSFYRTSNPTWHCNCRVERMTTFDSDVGILCGKIVENSSCLCLSIVVDVIQRT